MFCGEEGEKLKPISSRNQAKNDFFQFYHFTRFTSTPFFRFAEDLQIRFIFQWKRRGACFHK